MLIPRALQKEKRDISLTLSLFHPPKNPNADPTSTQTVGFPPSLPSNHLLPLAQVGCRGHSSVEDAQTAMELYRLVEVQWETELARSQPARPPSPPTDPSTDSNQYLDDQYWPTDLTAGSP